MRELELTVSVRNNRLKERRQQLGMTQAQLAAMVGIHIATYGRLECMRDKPYNQRGEWRGCALALAEFYDVDPEELFPPATIDIEQSTVVRKLDVDDLRELLSSHQERLLESPEDARIHTELREQVVAVLATLPPRQEKIMRLRYGLDSEKSLGEISEQFGISKERVRQIETNALRKLRHPSRSRRLRPFIDVGE